jgi:hypothetical protein
MRKRGEKGNILMSHSIQMKDLRAWTSTHQAISDANSGGGRMSWYEKGRRKEGGREGHAFGYGTAGHGYEAPAGGRKGVESCRQLVISVLGCESAHRARRRSAVRTCQSRNELSR